MQVVVLTICCPLGQAGHFPAIKLPRTFRLSKSSLSTPGIFTKLNKFFRQLNPLCFHKLNLEAESTKTRVELGMRALVPVLIERY